MTRAEYEALRGAGDLPPIEVGTTECENTWICTITNGSGVARFMAEDMQSTGGGMWEVSSDDFAYCLAHDNGEGFYSITNEIKEDGFEWEEVS